MPPNNKAFKSKSKPKVSSPQSETDFLAAAEDLEQAAGKWRAGDAAKASRFFQRAIQVYDEGLKQFPHSFDLAYNKAHFEYQTCEDDQLVIHLGGKVALLQETLTSHRRALALSCENSDILFNTGQVLTSLSESILESGTQATIQAPARLLLEEAAELFSRCHAAQQRQYSLCEQVSQGLSNQQNEESDVLWHTDTEADVQKGSNNISVDSTTAGEWATVEEAVTPGVILETCIAQLTALTTLIGLYDHANLSVLEQRIQDGVFIVNTSIPPLISLLDNSIPAKVEEAPAGPVLSVLTASAENTPSSTLQEDALLAIAIFQAATAAVFFRTGQSAAPHYATTVSATFSSLIQKFQSQTQQTALLNAHSAYADALIDVAETVSEVSSDLEIQWSALSQAQNLLMQMCTPERGSLLSASRLADIFTLRGDVDLVRFTIARSNEARPAWMSSINVLVSNSGVFYRAAKGYAEKTRHTTVARTTSAKVVVAEILKQLVENGDNGVVVKPSWKEQWEEVKCVLEQMVNESTLNQHTCEQILRILSE